MKPTSLFCIILLIAGIFPRLIYASDILTLEALIDAHKVMQKAELKALEQITVNNVEQTAVTALTSKVNQVQTVLHQKLHDVNSYLIFASDLLQTSMKMKKLIEEYSDFSSNTFHSVKENPMILAFYSSMNYKLAKEVSHLTRLIGMYAASGINLLKSSNDEKFKLIYMIQDSISSLRSIISYTEFQIRVMNYSGITLYTIQQVLPEELRNDLVNKQINSWNQQ